jgi:hypothetical protein
MILPILVLFICYFRLPGEDEFQEGRKIFELFVHFNSDSSLSIINKKGIPPNGFFVSFAFLEKRAVCNVSLKYIAILLEEF